MKHVRIISFLVVQSILLGASSLFAAPQMSLLKDSAVWIEGDSTLHRFSSTSTALTVDLEAQLPPLSNSENPFFEGLKKGELKKFELHVPVLSLKSEKSALDKNLVKALKAEDFPHIVFQMTGYDLKLSASDPKETEISVQGTLTIAGKSKDVVLRARAKTAERYTRATGSHDLLMTDYGVQPPSLMMGAIKTKNEIVVRYTLYFAFSEINKN